MRLQVLLGTARQYQYICMLILGFAASLAIVQVIHNDEIYFAIPKQRMLPCSYGDLNLKFECRVSLLFLFSPWA